MDSSRSLRTASEYFIVTLFVCLSGNPVFTTVEKADYLLIAVFVFLAILVLVQRKPPLTQTFCLVFFLFSMILSVQSVSFAFLPLVTVAGFLVRLFIGYAAVRFSRDFPRVYIDVLFYTCIVSLCFYVPEQLFDAVGYDFKSLFEPMRQLLGMFGYSSDQYHILIYNFERARELELHRNAAFFWEPGAFAGYILLALTFLGLQKDSYSKRFYMARFVVMAVALVTTLSTMGFLVLPIVLALHYRPLGSTTVAKLGWFGILILLLPLLGFGAFKVWNLEHMKQKITLQYEMATERTDRYELTRFGNVLYDWEYIKRRPILGWGLHDKTGYALHGGRARGGQGNGLSGFIRKFGFLGMGIFVLFAWKGLYKLSGNNLLRSALAMLAVLLSLNGEQFLNYPLYLGLMFLQKLPEQKREGLKRKNDPMDLLHSEAPTNRAAYDR